MTRSILHQAHTAKASIYDFLKDVAIAREKKGQ